MKVLRKKAPSLLLGVWLPVLQHWYSYWQHCLGDLNHSWRQLFNKNLEKASEEPLSPCFTQPCLCAPSGMWDSYTADKSILAIYSVSPSSQACFPLPWTSLTITYSPGNLDYWLNLVGVPNLLCSPCSQSETVPFQWRHFPCLTCGHNWIQFNLLFQPDLPSPGTWQVDKYLLQN